MNKIEFNKKIEKLKNNTQVRNLITDVLNDRNNSCNFKTYIIFRQWIIPFFKEEFNGYVHSAISYIFDEDIFNIGLNTDENINYFIDCFEKSDSKELSCNSCNNSIECSKRFGENIQLKESLLILYFAIEKRIQNKTLVENTIDTKMKSFIYSLESSCFTNKTELVNYLCNHFISPYLNNYNWGLSIAEIFYEINFFNNTEFNAVKRYYENGYDDYSSSDNKYYSDNYHNALSYRTLIEKNSALQELHTMIGLNTVKEQIEELYDLLCFKKLTENQLEIPEVSLNCTFEGNPGTGKTRTAKLYAKLLYQTGVIKSDKLICVCAKDLISDHIGGTSIKTSEVIEQALGGVLFIDEAYQLTPTSEKDFGRECIATLVREMTEHKNNLVVIFAGYKKEMQEFIDVNPGMKSRITNRITFDDYSIDELYEIFKLNVKNAKFKLSDEIENILRDIFKDKSKDKSFGNARFVENLFQKIVIKHSKNIMTKLRNKDITPNDENIQILNIEDIPDKYLANIDINSI